MNIVNVDKIKYWDDDGGFHQRGVIKLSIVNPEGKVKTIKIFFNQNRISITSGGKKLNATKID